MSESVLDVVLKDAGAVPAETPEETIPESLEEGSNGAGEPESPEAEETETAEVPQTLSVKELAQLLERDPAELYKTLQLDIGGDTISLGELKDRGKELASVDVLKAQATELQQETERKTLEGNRALKYAAQEMGVTITPELQEKVQAEFEAYAAAEGQKLLEAKPGWADTDKQRIGLDRIERTMKDFGFSDVEIQNSVDHRMRLAFHQLGELQDLLKDAASREVKGKRKQAPKKARRTGKGTLERIKQGHESGKVTTTDAVLALIADGAQTNGSLKP